MKLQVQKDNPASEAAAKAANPQAAMMDQEWVLSFLLFGFVWFWCKPQISNGDYFNFNCWRFSSFLSDMLHFSMTWRVAWVRWEFFRSPTFPCIWSPTALDSAAMADVQPADGIFLWHDAIYGGQCHSEPTGGKEGDGEGEAAFGDG